MCCSRPPSTMCSTCSAAIAPSSSTTWMRWALSRYLPVLVYPKGAPAQGRLFRPPAWKAFRSEVKPFWTPEAQTNSSGSVDAMQKAVDYLRKSGVKAAAHRRRDWRSCRSTPATRCASALRRQRDRGRAVRAGAAARRARRPRSCDKLRIASELVIDSMLAVIAKPRPGHDQARARRSAAPRGGQPRA